MKVVITDHGFQSTDIERGILKAIGAELIDAQCQSTEELIRHTAQADALLVQWAEIAAEVVTKLEKCKIIVRYGIGVDNIDLEACKRKGIPVSNVPDYCIDEVADHAVALALSSARQLRVIDRRLRSGTWKLTPDTPMPAFRDMTFAVAGFGRSVLQRVSGFKLKLGAYDPFLPDEEFEREGVTRLSLDALFETADILSLHVPLTPETRHMINIQRLQQMKPTAILVNTSRGPLIDTVALASSLQSGKIAFAGLDVFDPEPLPNDHPLLACENALLTSHVAWYSEASMPRLQRLATEEVVRGLTRQELRNQVNR